MDFPHAPVPVPDLASNLARARHRMIVRIFPAPARKRAARTDYRIHASCHAGAGAEGRARLFPATGAIAAHVFRLSGPC